jgi:hypothetical protein
MERLKKLTSQYKNKKNCGKTRRIHKQDIDPDAAKDKNPRKENILNKIGTRDIRIVDTGK